MSLRQLASNAAGEVQVVSTARPGGIDGVLSVIALSVVDAVENRTFDLHQVCDRPGLPTCTTSGIITVAATATLAARAADRQARYNARRAQPSRNQDAAR